MKEDFRASRLFRILAIMLSLSLIAIGVLALTDRSAHSIKFGAAALGFGVILLIVGVRGFLVK